MFVARHGPKINRDCVQKWFRYHSLTAIAILDRDFNFIEVNELYARRDGRRPEDFPGLNHFELYPSDAREIFEKVVATKRPFTAYERPFVYENSPERGETFWDWTLVPLLSSDGEVEYLVLSLNEVTERVKLEREVRRLEGLRLLHSLLPIVEHELRNPLASMRSVLQLIILQRRHRDLEDTLASVIAELDKMTGIINRFSQSIEDHCAGLDFSDLRAAAQSILSRQC